MSTIKKLQGGTDSELTRLKALWRGLEESAREFWRSQFIGPATQAATRQLLKSRLQISLASDNQLNRFRAWLADEDLRQKQADKMEANESMIMAAHPEWTPDQVRAEVIRAAYMQTLASGDFKLGLKTASVDLKGRALEFDQEKFKEGLRTKLEAGLAELAQYIKGNPDAQGAYEAFKRTVKTATE